MKQEHKVSKELIDRMIEINFPFYWNPYEVTVMEMLDVMPKYIWEANSKMLTIQYVPNVFIEYSDGRYRIARTTWETLPNALAEMILWLHENEYITF